MSTARQNAIASFCKLRRLQEATDNGYVRCISCGKVLPWNEADGGHYISRQVRVTEMDPENVWPQCKECNQLLDGNEEAYRRGLVGKIGPSAVDRLEIIAWAGRGSEESYRKLNQADREAVAQKKFRSDYISLKRKFDAESRKIRKEKGL